MIIGHTRVDAWTLTAYDVPVWFIVIVATLLVTAAFVTAAAVRSAR